MKWPLRITFSFHVDFSWYFLFFSPPKTYIEYNWVHTAMFGALSRVYSCLVYSRGAKCNRTTCWGDCQGGMITYTYIHLAFNLLSVDEAWKCTWLMRCLSLIDSQLHLNTPGERASVYYDFFLDASSVCNHNPVWFFSLYGWFQNHCNRIWKKDLNLVMIRNHTMESFIYFMVINPGALE